MRMCSCMSRFMLEKNMDLEISDSGQQISPRDWLVAGYDPEPVMVMLSALCSLLSDLCSLISDL